LTGSLNPEKREVFWHEERVFFLTPQVLQNDLARGTCHALQIVCLVFDEAHKAVGNHAYCQVVKEISGFRKNFRILALSATPGEDMKGVQQVVHNLWISNIEIRTEDSEDIKPYVFNRDVEAVIVKFTDDISSTRKQYVEILCKIVKRLAANHALWQDDPEKVSKFMLLKAREQWRLNNAQNDRFKNGVIEGDFASAISMYHAYDLLSQHGLLSFYNYMKSILHGSKGTARTKTELMKDASFVKLMDELHQKIEPDDLNQTLNETISAEKSLTPKQRLMKSIPKSLSSFKSHPKLQKLEEIVLNHFQDVARKSAGSTGSSRIMVFSQYRDSVQEITRVLSNHEPLIKPMSFVGQGSKEGAKGKMTKGLSQKEQFEVIVMSDFYFICG
jgi:Fanconi anemia group M protein